MARAAIPLVIVKKDVEVYSIGLYDGRQKNPIRIAFRDNKEYYMGFQDGSQEDFDWYNPSNYIAGDIICLNNAIEWQNFSPNLPDQFQVTNRNVDFDTNGGDYIYDPNSEYKGNSFIWNKMKERWESGK